MDPKDINQTPRTMTRDIKKSPPQLNILLDEFEDSDNEFDDGDHPEAMAIDSLGSSTNGHEEDSMLMLDSHTGDWEGLDNEGTQSTDSHISSPEIAPSTNAQKLIASTDSSKLSIIVKDASYTTYRAMLYYVSQQNGTSKKNNNPTYGFIRFTPITSFLLRCLPLLLVCRAMGALSLWQILVSLQLHRKALKYQADNVSPIKTLPQCPAEQIGLESG